jgi:hypothetical protein
MAIRLLCSTLLALFGSRERPALMPQGGQGKPGQVWPVVMLPVVAEVVAGQ